MVVNQAHLGCNKSVVLSLGSSRSGSRLPGFEGLTVEITLGGDYLVRLLYCSSMKITFCYGSACTWNQIVHEFHYLDTYICFQGLFWLTTGVSLSTDLQIGAMDSVVTHTASYLQLKTSNKSHLACYISESYPKMFLTLNCEKTCCHTCRN